MEASSQEADPVTVPEVSFLLFLLLFAFGVIFLFCCCSSSLCCFFCMYTVTLSKVALCRCSKRLVDLVEAVEEETRKLVAGTSAICQERKVPQLLDEPNHHCMTAGNRHTSGSYWKCFHNIQIPPYLKKLCQVLLLSQEERKYLMHSMISSDRLGSQCSVLDW